MGEFNGGGVFTLDNATFVGMGTFVADMGVITMSAHAHAVPRCLVCISINHMSGKAACAVCISHMHGCCAARALQTRALKTQNSAVLMFRFNLMATSSLDLPLGSTNSSCSGSAAFSTKDIHSQARLRMPSLEHQGLAIGTANGHQPSEPCCCVRS